MFQFLKKLDLEFDFSPLADIYHEKIYFFNFNSFMTEVPII